jgi:hypothetical protein
VDELSELPLGFLGFPALSCQNLRCSFKELDVSVRR